MLTRWLGKAAGFLEEYESASHLVYILGFTYHATGMHVIIHTLPIVWKATLGVASIVGFCGVAWKTRKSRRDV